MLSFFLMIGLFAPGQQPPPPKTTAPSQPAGQQPQPATGQTPNGQGAGATTTPQTPPRSTNTDPFFDPGAVRKRALLVPWESASSRAEYAKKQGLGNLGKYLSNEVTLVGIYEQGGEVVAGFRTPDNSGLTFATVGSRFFNGKIVRIVNDVDSKNKKVVVEGRLQPNGKIERIEIPLRKESSQ